jgi:hypothetical protein
LNSFRLEAKERFTFLRSRLQESLSELLHHLFLIQSAKVYSSDSSDWYENEKCSLHWRLAPGAGTTPVETGEKCWRLISAYQRTGKRNPHRTESSITSAKYARRIGES